jgi:hypothetical protein
VARTHDRWFDELNALEQRIARDEDVVASAQGAVEDARWHQAEIVVEMLDGGATQREVAAGWINSRTGKPYAQNHVKDVAKVWRRFGSEHFTVQDRPDWTTAYYTVGQGSDEVIAPEQRRQEWSDAHESRAPKTKATAEKFVENLQDAPPEVVETIVQGAREVVENRYRTPKERDRVDKEADAWAKKHVEPIIDQMSKNAIDLLFEQLLEEIRDVSEITAEERERYLARLDEIQTEVEVKYAMRSVS